MALFLLAPALNLLRFDLNETQLWVLGMRWSLGIDAFLRGEATAVQTGWAILWRGFLPALGLIAIFLGIAYRYGRLYSTLPPPTPHANPTRAGGLFF